MLNLQTLLPEIREALAPFPEAREEALWIIRECFSVRRHEVRARSLEPLSYKAVARCREILQRRKSGEPLAHILGHFYFYKHRFPVSPLTLIPRYDSEILVEEAVKAQPRRVLDVGTGTGVLALSLAAECPEAEIDALDIVSAPFKASVEALGMEHVRFIPMDFLDESLWPQLGIYDCIISNPPYLSSEDMDRLDPSVKDWEPASALYGGEDGLVFYRALERFFRRHLAPQGAFFLEVDHKFEAAAKIFKGYHVRLHKDYGGLERLLCGQKPSANGGKC